MKSVILKSAAQLVGAIVLVFAIYLLWRGHHAPGGGFIAALVASTGFALVLIAEGPDRFRQRIMVAPQHLIGTGIGLSVGAGFMALFQNKPFLTGIWWPPNAAILGTPLLFDSGVFLAVLGCILTVLLALEEN